MLDSGQVATCAIDSHSRFNQSAQAPPVNDSRSRSRPSMSDTAEIGKGLVFRGEISGSDDLVIVGKVEGTIHLEGGRVTVGCNGQAVANITAREVIVLGKVCGNVVAADFVDVRAKGAVIGDLLSPSVLIEDGAFIKGAICTRKSKIRQDAK